MYRTFPLISKCRAGMMVLWEDAEKAFATYSKAFPGQTMGDLAAQGGFGVEEFVYFYHGFIGPENEEGWPTDVCLECKGRGEVILSDDGGIPAICGKCLGAGALLPKDHPGVKA
jgi:hypothetical protein